MRNIYWDGMTTRTGRRVRLSLSGLLLLLAVILAACGADGNSAGAETTPGAANGAVSSNSDAAPDMSAGGATKSVAHLFGETVIPAEPERIVSIGLEDMLLSLEVSLAQANGMEGYYLYDRLQELGVPMLYAGAGLNYEAILAAQPDLIVVLSGLIPDQTAYEKLSQIAPALVYDRDQWRTSIVEIGRALGREDKAHEVIQAYDDTLGQAREAIVQAVGTDKTVAFVRPSDKEVQLFFPSFAYGSVLYNDLGMSPSDGVTEIRSNSAPELVAGSLSLEEVPSLDADYLFVTAGGSLSLGDDFRQAIDAVAKVKELKVWQSIPAVQQNHVYDLSARHWMLSGPIADSMKIADVVAAVVGPPAR